MSRRENWSETQRLAERIDRKWPGLRAVLCIACNKPGGTLLKAGLDNDKKMQYIHRQCQI